MAYLSHTVYNSLPSIQDADKRFQNREELLAKLTPLVAKYQNHFGACLVHNHTQLEPGEVMVATSDSVSEPVVSSGTYYPEKWLASGQAYEYSIEPPAHQPPPEFFEEFRKIVGPESPLGVFYVPPNAPEITTETNDGRKSYTRPGPPPPEATFVYSKWVPGTHINAGICILICVGC
jgi:hypothetical protein